MAIQNALGSLLQGFTSSPAFPDVMNKLLGRKEDQNLLTDPNFIQSLQVAQQVPALQKMFVSEYGEQLDDFIETPYNSDQYTGAGVSPQKFEAMQEDKLNVLAQQLFPQPEPEKPNPYEVLDQMLKGDKNITDYESQQFKQMFGVSPDRYYSPVQEDKEQPNPYKVLDNMLQGDNNITEYEAQQFEEMFGTPYTNFYSPQPEQEQIDVIAAANDFRELTSGDNPIPENTAVRLINEKYGTNFTKEELIKPPKEEKTQTDLVKAIKDFKDITEDGTVPPTTALQAINQKYGTNFTVDDLLISTDVDDQTKQDIVQYYVNNPKDFGIAVNQGIVTPEIVDEVNKALEMEVFQLTNDDKFNPYTPTILHNLWKVYNYEPKAFGEGVDFSKPKPDWQPYDKWVQSFLSRVNNQPDQTTDTINEPPNVIDLPEETTENTKTIEDLPDEQKKIATKVQEWIPEEEFTKENVVPFLQDQFGMSKQDAENLYNTIVGNNQEEIPPIIDFKEELDLNNIILPGL